MRDKILEIKSLNLGFKDKKSTLNVLDNVDITIDECEIVGVVGESGCGKSMTAMSIMKLLPENAILEGDIIFQGRNLTKMSENEINDIRGKEIAMIFQEPMTSLNPVYTVENQITEMLKLHTNMTKKEMYERSLEMLTIVNIPSPEMVLKQYPHELSGGMRQRAMIAMAMSCNPKLLIADEPTTALDVTVQAQILNIMKDLKTKFDSSILLITHDLGVINEMCDKVVVMYAGQVMEKSSSRELFENPKHPYTYGLMKCLVSDVAIKTEKLHVIKGSVPSPDKFTSGCRFASRCEHVNEKCHEKQVFTEVSENHYVRCNLFS